MTSAPLWILGSRGMLGSRIAAHAHNLPGHTLWQCPLGPFAWHDTSLVREQFIETVKLFAGEAQRAGAWTVVWAAGSGTVGSSEEDLQRETATFNAFLEALSLQTSLMSPVSRGAVFFASSAGTIYGETDALLMEETPPHPISAYGRAKLRQEASLRAWSAHHPEQRVLLGRIANLYGPRQNLRKPQGIISHIARSTLLRRPLRLYVPLDTIRDYLDVDDCAMHIIACLRRLTTENCRGCTTKIFASESVTTIGEVLSTFERISKRPVPVVHLPRAPGHVRSVRFRSAVWADIPRPQRTSLLVGMHRVYGHQLRLLASGQLRP
ncbi:MAG: NDP-sugar epimerase [Candidatus Peregrinibacteria bacterium Gr01-1014_25]|nr:MAG: NDP-sugar epimerase [Candidatus Peregrinibacteria bacterium Gr01-1014_25]